MSDLLWTPKDYHIGDATIIRVGDEYHLFTEQSPASWDGNTKRGFSGVRTVGHAVSRDLFRWEELPIAIACGPPGSFDAFSIYHMDVFVHGDAWWMFYTGLDKGGPGEQQSIGLATSRDGIRWEKHPANPILRADLRWYEPAIPREATYQEKDFGRLWFRDPCVIRDPKTGRFGMIVVARDQSKHPDVRGCLAWATSDDLVHWQPHPPIYSPGRFHTIETPSIFERGGRHYIVFMSHPSWGTPFLTTDPYQDAGDFYAVSTSGPTGPYEQPSDEILVAAHRETRMGACRTVDAPNGERFLYGWLRVGSRGDDAKPQHSYRLLVPPPRRIKFGHDGQMQVVYYERIESFCEAVPLPPLAWHEPERWSVRDAVTGKHFSGRTLATFGGQETNVIFSARVRFLRGERAGLILRADETGQCGWQVVADRRMGRIEFGLLGSEQFIDARRWQPADEVELKVVAYRESVEVYADDRLMIHQVRHRETTGRLGYLVERAEAQFENPRLLRFRRP
ncbi:MAG: hypothetical protein FJ279_03060 [Planctomycetes bacterium]|nr:hypothetical protein [Planctomycetota bacterium]